MTTFAEAAKIAKESENVASPMPEYQCHKRVWALKIKEVIKAPLPTIAELEAILNKSYDAEPAGAFIVPESHFAPIAVSSQFVNQHKPQVGGYLVFYRDGYRSYSPAKTFEEGYSRL